MTEIHAASAPVRERLTHIDMIRGVALFGILLMNVTSFGLPSSYSDPTIWGGATGANFWAWAVIQVFFEGTQRGMFSMLFGAGLILLTSRLEASGRTDTADIYYRRNLWLIGFGVIHSYLLLWTGEILFYYGCAALFLFALRNLPPRTLLTMAAAGLAIGALWNGLDSYNADDAWRKASAAQAAAASGTTLTPDQQDDLEAWKKLESDLKPDQRALDKKLAAYRGSYAEVFMHQAPLNAHYQSWWNYRYFFDVVAMMLAGMALFKNGVLRLKSPTSAYVAMVAAGYTIGIAVNYFELRIIVDGQYSILSFLRSLWTYDLGRIAMTIGHLGALLLFARSGSLPWLRRSLAAVGQLALSNYVTHSLVCALVFYGFGLGWYGHLERHQLYFVVFAIWIAQLIISPIWLARFQFGPVEWLWRSLTYTAKQPFRRGQAAATDSAAA